MSDHPKEAERNLKRIRICNDIYLDVFHWLAPAKVGLKLALVSHRFDALVDMHLKNRKWTIGNLGICSYKIVKLNAGGSNKTLPFPQKQLPNSVVDFARVDIFSTNSDVIAFLHRIGHLLRSDVCLGLNIDKESEWNFFTNSIWPLLNVSSAIIKIHFDDSYVFESFRRLTSPSVLRDCSNLRMITFICGQFLQFPPADDSKGSSDGQALCKWLHTPRADGQPKIVRSWEADDFPVDALKQFFLSAITSVSFIIVVNFVPSIGPFDLVNSLTNEQLTCQKIGCWLIERRPIDKSAEQWTEWEREAMKDEQSDWKLLKIDV